MEVGAFTGYIDFAQLVLYVFWAFFFGLIIYLRREDKREGYPLDSDRTGYIKVQGFPAMPQPKTFKLEDGTIVQAPSGEEPQALANAEPSGNWLGAPIDPVGDPMLAGIGPGSYAQRANHPERSGDGHPKLQPLRVATAYSLCERDADPRGMIVRGADGAKGGVVVDCWIDIEEPQIRYLEVGLDHPVGTDTVLMPFTLAQVNARRREIEVRSILGGQFAAIPRLANPDQVTLQEEERVVAYFGAGQLFATPERREPLI